jgi:hypothetical protein
MMLLCFFYDFDEPPTLVFAEGPGFHNPYGIADARLVAFVVRHKFGASAYEFAVLLMLETAGYHHGDGFFSSYCSPQCPPVLF